MVFPRISSSGMAGSEVALQESVNPFGRAGIVHAIKDWEVWLNVQNRREDISPHSTPLSHFARFMKEVA